MNAQPGVLFLVLLDGEFSPYPPVFEGGLIAVLHALEPSSSFLLYFRVLVSVGVDLDVDLKEVPDSVLSEFFLIAVFLETGSDKTELGQGVRPRPYSSKDTDHLSAPIPKVVDRSDVPPVGLVEVCEVGPNDSRSEVPDVEVLGNVRGGVLNDDSLPLPRIIPSIFRLAGGRVLG